jgi:hypothetical protein
MGGYRVEGVARLQVMRDRFGITQFVLWFNIGGIDPAHCEASMRLAMEKVIPHV